MIITGIALSMSYTAHVDYAFESVERIMRDVNHGWLLRYIHMNGAASFSLWCLSISSGVCIMALIKRRGIAVDSWGRYFAIDDGDGFYGLCSALGSDVLLGRYGDYQFVLGYPGCG